MTAPAPRTATKTRTTASTAPARRYVNSLDGLRALCVLGVLGYHMKLGFCSGGLLGVTVLFVLSGYLITSQLMSSYRRNRGTLDLRGFWVKRVRRLMPSAIVVVVVTAALCTLFNHVLLTKMRPDIVPSLFMYLNWAKIFSNESYFAAAGAPSPLTHYWSLAIEAQFYLVWPPILLLLMKRKARRRHVAIGLVVAAVASAILMAVLYVPEVDPSRTYYGTDTRAMSLLLGCALAMVWPFDRASARDVRKMAEKDRLLVEGAAVASVAALVLMMTTTEGYTSFSYYGGIFLCSVLSVVAVAALMPQGSIAERVASLKPLVWLGQRSYAIYLWHYPIILLLTNMNSTTEPPVWLRLLQVALSLGAAELSYRLVEQPFRNKLPNPREAIDWVRTSRIPAGAVAAVLAVAIAGVAFVPPVMAVNGGDGEHKVQAAALKRPLVDGVYDVVIIGDSVPLDAYDQLAAAFPYGLIDCKISRQASAMEELLRGYVDQGVVGDTVVFCAGTNGPLTTEQLDQMVADAGPDRQVWFVTNRMPDAWQDANNQLLAQCAEKYDNVHLIDWYSASAGHDEWFWADGTHTRPEGSDAYASLILDTMGYTVPTRENTTYDLLFVGDQIAIGASDALAEAFPAGAVDCADGRAPEAFAQVISDYAGQGVVGDRVAISMGSNDMLSEKDIDDAVRAAGTAQVWLVNTRTTGPWCDSNNKLLSAYASMHDNVQVIDWYAASAGHDDWFAGDGAHLSEAGGAAYAELVRNSIGPAAATEAEASPEDGASSSDQG